MNLVRNFFNLLQNTFFFACIAFVAYLVFTLVSFLFCLDFTQSYRGIDNYEGIVFTNGGSYRRTFAGLQEISLTAPPAKEKKEPDKELCRIIQERLGKTVHIADCTPSPDGQYILYVEQYNYSQGASTDTYEFYYRVLNLENGAVTTIYDGGIHYFNVAWLEHASAAELPPNKLIGQIAALTLLLALLYISYRSGALPQIKRMIPCAVFSLAVLFPVLYLGYMGKSALLMVILISIIGHWHRFQYFSRHMHITLFHLFWLSASIIITFVNSMIPLAASHGNGFSFAPDVPSALSFCNQLTLSSFAVYGMLFVLLLLYGKQQGRTYLQTMHIFIMTFFTGLFMLIGWATVIPVKYLSAVYIYGDKERDFLAE